MQRGRQESKSTFTKILHTKKFDDLSNKLKNSETNPCDYNYPLINPKSDHIQEQNTVDSLPQLSEKDKLVQELEKSLAVIDNHSSNLSRIEEERSAVEMERNSLLKEMEETIFEIQSHVVNAKELELEKKVIEEECNDLREQVEHLRRVLESSNSGEQDSLGALYEEEHMRNQALEEELTKLRSQNDVFLEKGHQSDSEEISVSAMERELELLHDENFNLQKQLQMAEESEDNMALELTESNAKITELQTANGVLTKENSKLKVVKEQLELECDDLTSVLEQLRLANSKLQDVSNANIVEQVSEEDKNALKKVKQELEKTRNEYDQLQQQNQAKDQKIRSLEDEMKSLKEQQPKAPQANGAVPQKGAGQVKQLKSVLEKLNKENARLHESVEKSEKEILSLKELLEKEKAEKKDSKDASKSKKSKGEDEVKEEGKEGVLSEEVSREIESLKKERHHLTAECDALSETVASTAKEKRKMEEEIDVLKEEISKQKSSMDELKAKIQDLEKVKLEKEALEQTLANQKKQYGDLTKKYENTNQKYYEKSSNLERAQLDRDHMDKKYKDLHKSVEKIKKELSDAQHEMLTRSDEVKFLKQKHSEEKMVLSSSLETDRKLHREMQDEVRTLSEELKATEAERRAIENAFKSKQAELNDLKESVEDLERKVGELDRQLSQVEKEKLEAEERAAVSNKATNELQKAQAVSSDMAMEKSLELSRTKRILEKKIEKLMKENLELRKKFELDNQSNSARSSPITVQQQVPVQNIDMDQRLAALRPPPPPPPPPRDWRTSEQDGEIGLVEQDMRQPQERTVLPNSKNYTRLAPKEQWHGNQEVENGFGEQTRRLPEEITAPQNYARFPARGQWQNAQENGLGEQGRFAEEAALQAVTVNNVRSVPRIAHADQDEETRRMPEEHSVGDNSIRPSAYHQKRGSLTTAGNRSDVLLDGFGHATFSVNRVKVTAASKPQPSAPRAYRVSQSGPVERPAPPAEHGMYNNSHGYEWKRPERDIDTQRREPYSDQYAYQMLKERSTVEQNASSWGQHRHGPPDINRLVAQFRPVAPAPALHRHHQPSVDPADNSNSVFQVVGYRKGKKFIHEDYV